MLGFRIRTSSSRPDKLIQPIVKLMTPNRHLQRIKRILHDKIRIKLITLLDNHLHIRLRRFRQKQKLDPRIRLETV